ncbi:hypothetical protein HME9304_00749 [Flagellimonas maritima]|uniref:Uncharacterized protein n=1 Tax=Flagellimonas maritima TaxID=1383885 RepID=A0A2Z4LQT4_9FLAO|nr:hypothetical protein [Allomuricauda aurantiaca]AWX43758.1 hypothetical protein HME9304_00749 [Allomuricauda aurantiaca]
MKKKQLIFGFLGLLFSFGCEEKDTTFLITENSIGPLLSTTPIDDLETIYAQDSIVKDTLRLNIGTKNKKIKIFEKGGKHLLTLSPNLDSVPTVENIRIFDPRYKTEKGIGLNSRFGEIQQNYNFKKVVTTLNSIVVFPKASNFYFTIDRKELPSNLQYTNKDIEAVQIPNDAKLKYLMLGWE